MLAFFAHREPPGRESAAAGNRMETAQNTRAFATTTANGDDDDHAARPLCAK